jgi:CheY-like chemotaxis protein
MKRTAARYVRAQTHCPSNAMLHPMRNPIAATVSPPVSMWRNPFIKLAELVRAGTTIFDRNGPPLEEYCLRLGPALRVMVADDCPINQAMTQAVLVHWGILPTCASTGREAVELQSQQSFDIILMDIEMPDLDGFEATSLIRSNVHRLGTPRVPVVAFSNLERASDRRLLGEFGFDDLLGKPTTVEEMGRCLWRWCASDSVPADLIHMLRQRRSARRT